MEKILLRHATQGAATRALLHFCRGQGVSVDPSRPSGRVWGASADLIAEVARLTSDSRFEYEVSLPASTPLAELPEELDGLNLRFHDALAAGVLLFERRSRIGESFIELIQDSGSFLPDSTSSLMGAAPASAQLQCQIVGSRRRRLRVSSDAANVPPAVVSQVVKLVPSGVTAEGWLYGRHAVLSRLEKGALVHVTQTMFGRSVVDELRGAASESVSGLSDLLELIEVSQELGASIDLPVVGPAELPAALMFRWKKPPGEVPLLAVAAPAKVPKATVQLLTTLAASAASPESQVN